MDGISGATLDPVLTPATPPPQAEEPAEQTQPEPSAQAPEGGEQVDTYA